MNSGTFRKCLLINSKNRWARWYSMSKPKMEMTTTRYHCKGWLPAFKDISNGKLPCYYHEQFSIWENSPKLNNQGCAIGPFYTTRPFIRLDELGQPFFVRMVMHLRRRPKKIVRRVVALRFIIIDVIIFHNIVEFRESKNFERMVQDGCPRLTFVLVDLALNQWRKWGHVYNTYILVSIAKYDDPLKGICQGTIDFLARQKIAGLQG